MDDTLILAIIPLVILQVAIQVYALVDLYLRGGARSHTPVWVIVILLGQLIGPLAYFVLGRREDVE